jgi:uncharacterized protein YjbJ (UPF0337 family)
MTDMSTGARAPDTSESRAGQVAGQAKQAAGQAATDVKDTAAEQARRVTGEASRQVRNTAAEVRDKMGAQARSQNDKLVDGIRRMADELEQMRGERQDSPAAAVVSRVADGGRQMADYLAQHGPDGVLREVQDFARRRPGAFLATALAAGFVVGRLGKGVMKADESAGAKPETDTFYSETGASGYPATTPYPADTTYTGAGAYAEPAAFETGTGFPGTGYPATTSGTEYPATTSGSTEYAATGTGTPVPLEQPYTEESPYRETDYESRPR